MSSYLLSNSAASDSRLSGAALAPTAEAFADIHAGEDTQRQARNWLLRTIRNQSGEFALIIALCNSPTVQREQILRLRHSCSGNLPELELSPSAKTLCSTIRSHRSVLNPGHTQALMVTGLDQVEALDDLLAATNNAVNALVRQVPYPLVLWMNNRVFRRLVRCAPDLANRAPAAIRFQD
ncbi:MAG: hypothetical protein AAGA67_02805 [Cyanobacteria bacterium P01_F01_bin.153]